MLCLPKILPGLLVLYITAISIIIFIIISAHNSLLNYQ